MFTAAEFATSTNLQIRLVLTSLTKEQRWNDRAGSQRRTDQHAVHNISSAKFDKRAKIN